MQVLVVLKAERMLVGDLNNDEIPLVTPTLSDMRYVPNKRCNKEHGKNTNQQKRMRE
jgi:hypothetical protein